MKKNSTTHIKKLKQLWHKMLKNMKNPYKKSYLQAYVTIPYLMKTDFVNKEYENTYKSS